VTYIDLSDSAMRQLTNSASVQQYVTSVATDLRDEIVAQMDPGPVRTGREYRVPGTGVIDAGTGKIKRGTGKRYKASAPGQPPAVRLGEYAGAWQVAPATVVEDRVVAAATNDRRTEDGEHAIGEVLEYGTEDGRIEPRPHIRPAMDIVAARYGGRVVEGE
jgi:hypothetical protein